MASKTIDTYSYQGWLNSDSFWKRAFGIFGYSLAASLALYLVLGIVVVLCSVIAVFVFGMSGGY